MREIGFLGSGTDLSERHLFTAFQEGLAEAGFVIGQNISIEHRAAEGRYDTLPAMAADFGSRKVAIIAASGPPAVLAAKAATSTIPILFVIGYDPVQLGLVSSLNRPGSNITGATFFTGALGSKRLDLALQLAPNSAKIGMLVNPNSPTSQAQVRDMQDAARGLGREVYVLEAKSASEMETAFQKFVTLGTTLLLLGGDAVFMSEREKLVALAAQYSLPTIFDRREYPEVGGLLSYGTSFPDAHRRLASMRVAY